MKKWVQSLIILFSFISPIFAHAEEGFIGGSLGTNFYSVIDEGSYSLRTKLVDTEMKKKPTLGDFGMGCPGVSYIESEKTSTDILDYGNLTLALGRSEKLKNEKRNFTTDEYQALMLCLNKRYTDLVVQKEKEIGKLQKISSLGLYADGTTENSDYDIMVDIDRINGILFGENEKYNGVKNTSAKSLKNTLAGKSAPPLFGSRSGTGGTDIGPMADASMTEIEKTESLASLIGESCSPTDPVSTPIDSVVDSIFLSELDVILGGNGDLEKDGSGTTSGTGTGDTGSGTVGNPGDFYHSREGCDGIFCIDVKFVGSSQNALQGGKSTSLESIITKHTKILEPIAASNLGCQRMTNQMGEAPFDKIKLKNVFSGLNVIYKTKTPKSKRLKSETTVKTEKEDLLKIQRCAYASAGLSTDVTRAHDPLVAGYRLSTASNTETTPGQIIVTSPQNLDQYAVGAQCMELYMDEGRRIYYDSFATDITEIEGFTRSIVQSITDMINIGTAMNSKPTGCK